MRWCCKISICGIHLKRFYWTDIISTVETGPVQRPHEFKQQIKNWANVSRVLPPQLSFLQHPAETGTSITLKM